MVFLSAATKQSCISPINREGGCTAATSLLAVTTSERAWTVARAVSNSCNCKQHQSKRLLQQCSKASKTLNNSLCARVANKTLPKDDCRGHIQGTTSCRPSAQLCQLSAHVPFVTMLTNICYHWQQGLWCGRSQTKHTATAC